MRPPCTHLQILDTFFDELLVLLSPAGSGDRARFEASSRLEQVCGTVEWWWWLWRFGNVGSRGWTRVEVDGMPAHGSAGELNGDKFPNG